MRVAVLTTGTNNVPPILDGLRGLGNELELFVYDEMPRSEHESILGRVEEYNPDWVLYVGALIEHHGKPVVDTTVLASIGKRRKLVHLCFDGAEHYWFPRLQEYYDRGHFALQVTIDGVRTGPIGDRGLVALCPVDMGKYINRPWSERAIWCGFSGGLHAGRPEIVTPLVSRGMLVYRPRDETDDHGDFRRFLEMSRISLNIATTGGVIGGTHVKHRCLESAAAGCLVLENSGSPLGDWFRVGEDFVSYQNVDDVVGRIAWTRENTEAANRIAASMTAKVSAEHTPAVFWSQVLGRLGMGAALRPERELPYRNWVQTSANYGTLPTVGNGNAAPRLVEAINGINIVSMNGTFYTVPQRLGSVFLEKIDLRQYPDIRGFSDITSAMVMARGMEL